MFDIYPNRTMCAVLEEMRQCTKTRNYSYLLGLIEEVQHMGNRMESKLEDSKDGLRAYKEISKLKKEINLLEEKKEALND